MSDLLIKQYGPAADDLRRAVAEHDRLAVADIIAPMDRYQLEALAVVLAALHPPTDTDAERIDAAIGEAARAFGTSLASITSGSKYREDVDARAVACYAARLLGCSYSLIGRQIGRDHSTVMHACGRVGETPRLRKVAQRIAGQLGWDRELVAS